MPHHSRRDFLKYTATAGAAAALGGGVPAFAQDAAPSMVIARWSGAPVPEEEVAAMAIKLTTEAIAALGGMARFVKKGDAVWVKPNIGWDKKPEFAANTNPDVVGTLVKLCYDAGAKKVKVGDLTCNSPKATYANSGIEAAARAAGAEVVLVDKDRFREVTLGGKRLEKWAVYPDIVESDLVINVPVVKHHVISKITACMKNYMGVIGGNRSAWHQDIPNCLCDITAYMKPKLSVLDAIRILTANGPTGGNLQDVKRTDTVAAGTDIVALDAFGAELLGHKSADLEFLVEADRRGLGKMEYRLLSPKELSVA